ncbi:MAG: hypothetical protein IKS96_04190, partial [Fibrobacter sp.]|nr:hypothetical protein [Fibrobacter sp.]
GGSVAKYFDPKDASSIAKALENSIDDKGKYDDEIKEWVSRFSWESCAKKIRQVAIKAACAKK